MPSFELTLNEGAFTDKDSYFDSGAPTQNFGNAVEIIIGKNTNFGTRHSRGIIGRDVSADFPAGAIIDTCGLRLRTSSIFGTGATDAFWAMVIDPWTLERVRCVL